MPGGQLCQWHCSSRACRGTESLTTPRSTKDTTLVNLPQDIHSNTCTVLVKTLAYNIRMHIYVRILIIMRLIVHLYGVGVNTYVGPCIGLQVGCWGFTRGDAAAADRLCDISCQRKAWQICFKHVITPAAIPPHSQCWWQLALGGMFGAKTNETVCNSSSKRWSPSSNH